jgi:hypothetical protein
MNAVIVSDSVPFVVRRSRAIAHGVVSGPRSMYARARASRHE